MDNEILIAGMDKLENPFSRFVNQYGFHIVHMPYNAPTRDMPKCRAAVICTFQISHDLRNRVVEEYKKRDAPFIEAKQGSSSIKDQFEQLVVDPIKTKLEPLDIKDRIIYLIMLFNRVGTKFHGPSFMGIVGHYTKSSGAYVQIIYSKLKEEGVLEKLEGKGSQGMYKVIGLTKPERSRLINKIGESLPDKWLAEPSVESIKVVEPVQNEQSIEAPKPEAPVTEISQLLHAVNDLKNIVAQNSQQTQTMVRAVERISLTVNRDSKESDIMYITSQLQAMPAHEVSLYRLQLEVARRLKP